MGKLLRSIAHYGESQFFHGFLYTRLLQAFTYCLVQFVHDFFGRAFRRGYTLPGIHDHILDSRLSHGWRIGQLGGALLARNRQRPEFATLYMCQHSPQILEGNIYLCAQQICNGCATSFVGDINARCIAALSEHRSRQMI